MRKKTRPIPEEIKNYLAYNPETGEFKWKSSYSNKIIIGRIAGTKTVHGYIAIKFKGLTYLSHRIALFMKSGSQPWEQVDHIDGDRSNNKLENLRSVDQSENQRNQQCHREGKLSCVFFDRRVYARKNPWRAQINIGSNSLNLGNYPKIQYAIIAKFLYENDNYIAKPIKTEVI